MSEAEQIDKIIDQYSIHRPRGQAKGTLARAELKKRLKKVIASQPIHPVDGELREQLRFFQYPGVQQGIELTPEHIDYILQLFAAHLQAAVREARKEERHLLQRELDSLRQLQQSVIERDMLKIAPIVLCAGCSKQLTQSSPKPTGEK